MVYDGLLMRRFRSLWRSSRRLNCISWDCYEAYECFCKDGLCILCAGIFRKIMWFRFLLLRNFGIYRRKFLHCITLIGFVLRNVRVCSIEENDIDLPHISSGISFGNKSCWHLPSILWYFSKLFQVLCFFSKCPNNRKMTILL